MRFAAFFAILSVYLCAAEQADNYVRQTSDSSAILDNLQWSELSNIPRTFNFTNGHNFFNLESKLKFANQNQVMNRMLLNVQSDNCTSAECPFRFRLSRFDKDSTIAEIGMRFSLESLVEFNCSGVAQPFNRSKLIQELKFHKEGWQFNTPVRNRERLTTQVSYIGNQTHLQLTITTAEEAFVKNGRNFTSQSVKVDIEINNFQFQKNNSCLALKMKAQTSGEAFQSRQGSFNSQDGEQVSQARSGSGVGIALGWETSVQVGNSTAQMQHSGWESTSVDTNGDTDAKATDMAREAYFTVMQVSPGKVVWDPYLSVVGDVYDDSNPSSPGLSSATAPFMALIAALAAYLTF
jgi:hypothetical protein